MSVLLAPVCHMRYLDGRRRSFFNMDRANVSPMSLQHYVRCNPGWPPGWHGYPGSQVLYYVGLDDICNITGKVQPRRIYKREVDANMRYFVRGNILCATQADDFIAGKIGQVLPMRLSHGVCDKRLFVIGHVNPGLHLRYLFYWLRHFTRRDIQKHVPQMADAENLYSGTLCAGLQLKKRIPFSYLPKMSIRAPDAIMQEKFVRALDLRIAQMTLHLSEPREKERAIADIVKTAWEASRNKNQGLQEVQRSQDLFQLFFTRPGVSSF